LEQIRSGRYRPTGGIHLGLDDIRGDEVYTMLILEDESEKLDRETLRQN